MELLKLLANNLATLLLSGDLEASPAPMFYSASGHYASITNKCNVRVVGHDTILDVNKPCHKDGLCFWHLAGKLGFLNKKNAAFTCRDGGTTHVDLNLIPIATVRALVVDEAFMCATKSEDLRDKVRQAVEDQRRLFKR